MEKHSCEEALDCLWPAWDGFSMSNGDKMHATEAGYTTQGTQHRRPLVAAAHQCQPNARPRGFSAGRSRKSKRQEDCPCSSRGYKGSLSPTFSDPTFIFPILTFSPRYPDFPSHGFHHHDSNQVWKDR